MVPNSHLRWHLAMIKKWGNHTARGYHLHQLEIKIFKCILITINSHLALTMIALVTTISNNIFQIIRWCHKCEIKLTIKITVWTGVIMATFMIKIMRCQIMVRVTMSREVLVFLTSRFWTKFQSKRKWHLKSKCTKTWVKRSNLTCLKRCCARSVSVSRGSLTTHSAISSRTGDSSTCEWAWLPRNKRFLATEMTFVMRRGSRRVWKNKDKKNSFLLFSTSTKRHLKSTARANFTLSQKCLLRKIRKSSWQWMSKIAMNYFRNT